MTNRNYSGLTVGIVAAMAALIAALIAYMAALHSGVASGPVIPAKLLNGNIYIIQANPGGTYTLRQISISALSTQTGKATQLSCPEVDYPISAQSKVSISALGDGAGVTISSGQPYTTGSAFFYEDMLDADNTGILTNNAATQDDQFVIPINHIGWIRNDPSTSHTYPGGVIIGHLDQLPLNDTDSGSVPRRVPVKLP